MLNNTELWFTNLFEY